MTNRKKTTYNQFHIDKQKRCLEIVLRVAPQKLPPDCKDTAKNVAALIGVTPSIVHKLREGGYVSVQAMETILTWEKEQ